MLIIGGISLYRTFALYKEEKSFNVLKGKVPDFRKCKYNVGDEWTFEYLGGEQQFEAPCDGTYKIELWGASGGNSISNAIGSNGGYTRGNIDLTENKVLYIYIGGQGKTKDKDALGGYNGGGNSTKNSYGISGPTGGGATDVRLTGGVWDNFDSLKSRIMVAAGGGSYNADSDSSAAGGITGYNGIGVGVAYVGKGGTQTAGGAVASTYSPGAGCAPIGGQSAGSFGKGGKGGGNSNVVGSVTRTGGGAGGGGGYYGGSGASGVCNGIGPSGGGSSYISGHEGCVAIDSASTSNKIIPAEDSLHYSGYFFTETVIIDGLGYRWTTEKEQEATGMPTHDGSETMMGNSGDGYAKITFLGLDKE